ncbi:MAG: hypothetical protein LBO72_08630 [Helicobacteraceae bacterium]|jgi:hypothetical protein|nr:hypothetical protein [Helicobacteraceae bacterium]
MKIASLVEVARGRLLNAPSIEAIGGFSFSPQTTRRGDCYFHSGDESALNAAIANGAFAAVFERSLQPKDGEIAWIAVDDMNRSLSSLARYLLIERNIPVFRATKTSAAIAKSVIADKRVAVDPSCKDAIALLSRKDAFAPLFICGEQTDLIEAAIHIEPFSANGEAPPIAIARETILRTDILYEGRRFALALPSLFLPELRDSIAFARRFSATLRFDRLAELDRFRVFPISNGERALIFDRANDDEAKEAIAFIRRVAPWAKIYVPSGDFDPRAAFTCAYLNGFDTWKVFDALPKFDAPPLFALS